MSPTSLPNSTIDPTTTKQWLVMADESMLSPAEVVIIRNQQYMMMYLQGLNQKLDALLSQKVKPTKNSDGKVDIPDTESETAFSRLQDHIDTVLEHYTNFVKKHNKKIYKSRTEGAEADAIMFFDELRKDLEAAQSNTEAEQVVLSLLPSFNNSWKRNIYATLGRRRREIDASKDNQSNKKRAPTKANKVVPVTPVTPGPAGKRPTSDVGAAQSSKKRKGGAKDRVPIEDDDEVDDEDEAFEKLA